MSYQPPGQLELFEVQRQNVPIRREAGRINITLRHDQLILAGIGMLIGLAILFAFGVERGKRLARAEATASQAQDSVETPAVADEPPAPVASSIAAVEPVKAQPKAVAVAKPEAPVKVEKPKETKVIASAAAQPVSQSEAAVEDAESASQQASAKGRFAVQLVTYTQPQLARKELERLQDKGEKAFLITKRGRTVLMAGPFDDKEMAADQVAKYRNEYRDCFLKPL